MQKDIYSGPVGIIGALDIEINEILKEAEIEKTEDIASVRFYSCTLFGTKCVVAKCGVGKVNAAVCAQTMIMRYAPGMVINIGIAGGLAGTRIGDVVIATALMQHDFDTSPIDGEEYKYVIPVIDRKEIPCDERLVRLFEEKTAGIYGKSHTGIIASGDAFIASNEKCESIHAETGALAVEMEGAAVAQVCCLNEIPAAVMRTISDNANDDGKVDYLTFAEESARKVQQLMGRVLKVLAENAL